MNPSKTESLPDIASLFSNSWALYKNNINRIVKVGLLPVILNFVFLVYIAEVSQFLRTFRGVPLDGSGSMFWYAVLTSAILSVVYMIVSTLYSLAQIYIFSNSQIDVKDAYKKATSIFYSYLWVGFITWLVVIGGFVLLIIPGFIFAVYYSMSGFVVSLEGIKGGEALSKSKKYIYGIGWHVFFRFLCIGIFSMIVSFIYGTIENILVGVSGTVIVGMILRIVYTLAVTPYFFVAMYQMYLDVKKADGATAVSVNAGETTNTV